MEKYEVCHLATQREGLVMPAESIDGEGLENLSWCSRPSSATERNVDELVKGGGGWYHDEW